MFDTITTGSFFDVNVRNMLTDIAKMICIKAAVEPATKMAMACQPNLETNPFAAEAATMEDTRHKMNVRK
jgi:hypothetical protein